MQNTKILNVLINKNFRRLWLAEITSYLGDAVVQIALIAWIMTFMDKVGSQMAMVIFFFSLSGLSLTFILLIREAENWGWSVPSFAYSWEQLNIWATYALILFLFIAFVVFSFGSRQTRII